MRPRSQGAAMPGLLRFAAALGLGCALASPGQSPPQPQQTRVVEGDLQRPRGQLDSAFRLCVGSGHAALLLRKANLDQLAEAHRDLGFQFIRFHGLLTDDMNVFHRVAGEPVYDWSRIDQVYDAILALGMKPFVELSFMPGDLASGSQTIFYWKANVTPPNDPALWSGQVEALARHLEQRYGSAEVKSWYFEVWNEPNYPGFWPKADQSAYFRLYDATAAAIKRVNAGYRVGGPATAGAGWVPEFLAHGAQQHVPIDFVSTHTYAVSSGFLDSDGNADLVLSQDPASISGDVARVRQQIDRSAQPELPLLMTEWSASYSSRDPVHDSYLSAAFILDKLKRTEGNAAAMSYWTYSDLFEENGPPPAAFHGGFGLLSRDDIRKPAYFAYKYLNELGSTELENSDSRSWLTRAGGGARALLWDSTPLPQSEGDKAFFRKLHPAADAAPVLLRLKHLRPGKYRLTLRRTGYDANDAYSAYIRMGLPTDLTPEQIAQLKQLAADRPESEREVTVDAAGTFERSLPLRQNDVLFIALSPE